MTQPPTSPKCKMAACGSNNNTTAADPRSANHMCNKALNDLTAKPDAVDNNVDQKCSIPSEVFTETENCLSDQIIQKLDDGFTTTWQRVNSPTTLQQATDFMSSNPSHRHIDQLNRSVVSQRPNLKRHKSETRDRDPRLSEVKDKSYSSSSENLHHDGTSKNKSTKFLKAVSLASRLHSSPSTGRKLATYHLIANPQSGTLYVVKRRPRKCYKFPLGLYFHRMWR